MAVAAQLLVEQWVHLLDEARLQQQGAYLSSGADMADAPGLAQHACFVGRAQVRQQAAAQVDAFADVQRQVAFLPVKDIHPGRGGHVGNGLAQVRGVFIGAGLVKLGAAAGRAVHGSVGGGVQRRSSRAV